ERYQNDRYPNDSGYQNDRGYQGDRPRFRDDRPPRQDRPDRFDRPVAASIALAEEPEPAPPAPVETPAARAPVLRSDGGDISHAPAFLQVRAADFGEGSTAETDGEPRRPRRRRAPPAETPTGED
ncbi:MAG: hypothetical protein JOZ27_08410, partial [Caulobacteraceae bacterium]|nr:hypothetical protein [Caulobacteraceae bacterium]